MASPPVPAPASPPLESLLTISIPFGEAEASATSSRYVYNNAQRGPERFVIIQRTHSGWGRCRWKKKSWDVSPGQAFLCLVPESSSYGYPATAKEPWRFSWLNLYGPLAVILCTALREEHGPVLPLPDRSTAQRCFQDLITGAQQRLPRDPADASLAAFTFLTEWKRLLDHPDTRNTDPVDAVIHICRTRFRERLGIKELADQAGLSREHLTRIFSARVGLSPARYLRHLRTNAAREMRQLTGASWTETALRCGFPSVKSLRRALSE